MKKCMLIISICLLLYSPFSIAKKFIVNGSGAARCMQALSVFMSKSNVLSEDLKQACNENPHHYDELGTIFLAIVFLADQRPDSKEIDKATERFMNGTAQVNDCLVALKEISCYGEAVIKQEKLLVLNSEPTKPDYIYLASMFDLPHESALKKANDVIERLGKKMEWPEEKIKQEKEQFENNIAYFLKNKNS